VTVALRLLSGVGRKAPHPGFNIAIGCRHAIEAFQHSLILLRLAFLRELAMQSPVAVRHATIQIFDIGTRVTLAQALLEIMRGFRHGFSIAANASTFAIFALTADLGGELTAGVIEPCGGRPQ
jgi:hypothetical protein